MTDLDKGALEKAREAYDYMFTFAFTSPDERHACCIEAAIAAYLAALTKGPKERRALKDTPATKEVAND